MYKAESVLNFPATFHCSTVHTLTYSTFLHKKTDLKNLPRY